MSRSHSYSHHSGHSRGSRRRGSSTLAVTEASFQGLQLNETAGTQHTASYTASASTYPRPSSRRGELTASYLQPEYGLGDFAPPSPPENFVDPRVFGDYRSSDTQRLGFLGPETAGLGIQPASTGSSVYSGGDMSTYPYPHDTASSHYPAQSSYMASRSSSMQNSPYPGGDQSRRSMSGPAGPPTLPSSAFSGLSTQERVIARQRRRGLQEPRRQAKVRLRRAILPSTSDAGSSRAPIGSHSTDFLAASSSTSSHDINYTSGPLSYGDRTSTLPSGRSYVSGSPSLYDSGYQPGYGISNVSSSSHTPVVPSSTLPDPYPSGRRTSQTPMGPHPGEPIRIVEQPSKPQCWDHGCNGRQFSTFSNLLRHQREKSGTATKSSCPRCGAEFTRTTARNGHMQHEKCKPRSG